MRSTLILLPLLLCASPAVAQAAPQVPQVPPQLTDPATTQRLVDVMQSLSKAFLDLPVGNVEAALEGRRPVASDRRRTIATETRMSERELRARIEQARPVLEQSMKVLADALPSMMHGLAEAQSSIERAAANMPDPNYPKR